MYWTFAVGRPDRANTRIKTIQYLAEADGSRVLVALDLKAAFHNVSRRAMSYNIEQNDVDLADVFSKWYTGTTEHRMHYDSAYTKISGNSGVDQGCPLATCGFSVAIDPVLRIVLAAICRQYDTGAKLFALMTGIIGLILSTCCKHLPSSQLQPDQSTSSFSPPRVQIWRASCQDPIPAEPQDKVRLALSCLGGHLQIHGDTEPSPVVLGEQATMEKTTQRFQKIATTLADLNAEGFNAQTVDDLLTMYVRAASQHVLRMSFCAMNKMLTTSTGRSRIFGPTSFNATSPLHYSFYSLNLEDLVWALQFNAMQPLHGALGSRSFPH